MDVDVGAAALVATLLQTSWRPGTDAASMVATCVMPCGERVEATVNASANSVSVRVRAADGQAERRFAKQEGAVSGPPLVREPLIVTALLMMEWNDVKSEALGCTSLPCGTSVQLAVSRTGFVHVFVLDVRGKFLHGYVKNAAGEVVGPYHRD